MRRWLIVAGVFYVACTVVFTWPLPAHLGTHVRAAPVYGMSDLHLHLWTLAWVARTVARNRSTSRASKSLRRSRRFTVKK